MVGLPMTSLTSCGFFSSTTSTTVNTITGIETGVDAYGNIVLTITFSNMDPVVITIPTGTTGSDGVGIESIYYSPSEDGTSTIVTIIYTDPDKDPDVIVVPNGSTLISADTVTRDGVSYIIFTFQVGNETMEVEFEIPKGDQGDQGVGISSITSENSVDGDGNPGVTMTINLTNGDKATIFIPTGGQGDAGKGIYYINAYTNGDLYVVEITYTDGTSETISFDKPADGNSWYTGYNGLGGVPEGTKDGDFYFDLTGMTIYLKRNGQWVVVCSFTTDQTRHTVSFDLNDDDGVDVYASMPTDDDNNWSYPYSASILHNSYFQTETNGYGSIPIPTRDGFNFIGWCTSKTPSVVSGYLTETTPILSDLYLYAIWEEIK